MRSSVWFSGMLLVVAMAPRPDRPTQIPSVESPRGYRPVESDDFRILSYNAFLRAPSQLFRDDQDRRTRLIPNHLLGYDLVVLQEAFSDAHRDRILGALDREYPYHTRVIGHDRWLRQDGGVILLSRWPIEAEEHRVFSGLCAQSDCWAQKGVAYARMAKDGRNFHVFGTHLQADYENSDMPEIWDVRRQQLGVIRDLVDSLEIAPDDVVLFVGDFNIDSYGGGDQPEYESLLQILSASEPQADPGPGHIPSWDGLTNSMVDGESRQRLDHVLISARHAQPRRARSRVLFLRDSDGRDLSDHHAVEARFEFGSIGATTGSRFR